MITIVKKKSVRIFADCIQKFKEPELFKILSWKALHTLFNDKKGGTIYICFPYKWKRQFLRRENKDIDSQSSHSKVVDSAVFILCVWNIYNWKKKRKEKEKIVHTIPAKSSICRKETSFDSSGV